MTNNNYSKWIICLSISLFFFFEIGQLSLFNVANHYLTITYQLNALSLAHLSSIYLLACAIILIPAGVLLDQYATRQIMLIVITLAVLGTVPLFLLHNFYLIYMGRILLGIGNAFSFLACLRLLNAWFKPNLLGLAIGICITIGMLGGVIVQSIYPIVSHQVGWLNTFKINTGLGIIILLLNILFLQEPSQRAIVTKKSFTFTIFFDRLKSAAANSINWLCGLYTGVLNIPLMLLAALWGNLYLEQAKGFSNIVAGNISGLIFWGLIIGSPLLGFIANTYQKRIKIMFYAALLAIIVMMFIIFTHETILFISLLFLLLGILSSAQTLSYPIVSACNHSDLESTSLGIVAVIVNIIGAFSQTLFGALLNQHVVAQISASHYYALYLSIIPVAFFIGTLSTVILKKKLNHHLLIINRQTLF